VQTKQEISKERGKLRNVWRYDQQDRNVYISATFQSVQLIPIGFFKMYGPVFNYENTDWWCLVHWISDI
jgi:hypothetical protein